MNSNNIWSKIQETAEEDYYSLSNEERIAYNIKNVLDAVNGSGLLSFYECYHGDFALDAVDDLYSVGMDEIASILENSNAIFPGGCPPEDVDSRLEIIDSWEHEYDSLFEQWTDDILEFSAPLEKEFEKIISNLE